MTSSKTPEAKRGGNRNPTGKGGFPAGRSGNPGGLTKEQRAARELLDADLRSPEMVQAWKDGYRKALHEGNPTVLVDYANRLLGKPKESVEVSAGGGDDALNALLRRFSSDEQAAIAKGE